MRISNYPTDTLTGTELILATDVNTSTQEYKTVNFSVDTLKTFLVGTDDTNEFTDIVLGGSLKFEGATADARETTLKVVDPTQDRDISLPNASGFVAMFLTDPGEVTITSTPAEVNYLDITVLGTSEASKAVTADASGDIRIEGANDKDIFWDRSENTLTFESGVKIAGSPTFTGALGAPLKIGGNLELENDSGDLVLEIDNNAANGANFQIFVGAGNRRTDFIHENDLQGTSVTTTISLKDQKVGILQTNPAYTLDVNGNLKCGGIDAGVDNEKIRLGNDNDVEIYHNGSTHIDSGQLNTYIKGGNLYLDINPSGGSSVIYLQTDGNSFGYIARDNASPTTSDLEFKVTTSDADMVFKGNDGGSAVTALALDMSAAGYATFNSGVSVNGDLVLADSGDDLKLTIDNNAANSCALDIMSGTGNDRIDFVLPDTAGSALLTLKGQKVGIMQTNPAAALDVNGGIKATSAVFAGDVEITGSMKYGGGGTSPTRVDLQSTQAVTYNETQGVLMFDTPDAGIADGASSAEITFTNNKILNSNAIINAHIGATTLAAEILVYSVGSGSCKILIVNKSGTTWNDGWDININFSVINTN